MMNQEQMQQMNENMSRMQGMMQEMGTATSDAERRRIREQHMESMQEHMGMMRGSMMRGSMMGQGMKMGDGQDMMSGQGMMNGRSKNKPDKAQGTRSGGAGMDSEQRLEMMEQRMNQMQLMMEQMLEHQAQTRSER
ncbi:MAG: hypothetical protein ACQEV6_00635 [Pseudomonadota bacterium]